MWDTDPHVPSPFDKPARPGGPVEHPDERSPGGRGLLLVRQWADRWGGQQLGDDLLGEGLPGREGKVLWFELDARSRVDVKAAA
ncbi:hypothetical protein ACFS5L_12195 [Streptomyces phyllanthi]|uniref:hypothetical protein n=1 Tax=Streptomyces phyllanthi TaxID=1803180 RepID=UPI002AD3FFE4|nr:hypothetical protein [Streptomyces phyllanthi]